MNTSCLFLLAVLICKKTASADFYEQLLLMLTCLSSLPICILLIEFPMFSCEQHAPITDHSRLTITQEQPLHHTPQASPNQDKPRQVCVIGAKLWLFDLLTTDRRWRLVEPEDVWGVMLLERMSSKRRKELFQHVPSYGRIAVPVKLGKRRP